MHSEQPPLILTPVQALIILVVVFAIPVLLLNPVFDVGSLPSMLLESLGLGFLWNSKSIDDEVYSYDKRRSKRKKLIRSRAEQSPTLSEGLLDFSSLGDSAKHKFSFF
jgi:hypothetical protein